MNKLTSLLIAGAAALAMAGCAHNKVETPSAPPPQPHAAATQTSNNSSAQTSAAASNGALSSQALANGTDKQGGKQLPPDQAVLLKTTVFHFDYDSDAIHHGDYAALSAHASYLADNPSARLRLEGNCDERGTREYNMALGERRAKAVAAFLTAHGANASQLAVISYGKEKPVATGHDESSWAQNRRVELHYTAGTP